MEAPRILAFSGSLRADSWNQKVVTVAADAARAAGAEVTVVHLADFDLPVLNEDTHRTDGMPAGAVALKDHLCAHEGLLIASPEYNSSLTAALKNAIDWASVSREGEAPMACFRGKVAGLLAASPGPLGGLRGLGHLRSILSSIGVHVIPEQRAVGRVHELFDGAALTDEAHSGAVADVGRRVAEVVIRLHGKSR